VAHAGVMRMVICHVLGLPPAHAYRLNVASAGMARIRVEQKDARRLDTLLWLTRGRSPELDGAQPRVLELAGNWLSSTRGAGSQPGLRCSATTLGENAAAHIELGGQAHEAGIGGAHQVVEDAVGDVFVEMPFLAERPDVELQALQFHTALVAM